MSLTQTKLSRRSRGNNPSAFALPPKCIWEELARMDKKQGKKWRFSFPHYLFRNINMAKQTYLLLYSRNRLIVSQKWALQGWAFRLSFPRVRARIPSNFRFFAFTTFTSSPNFVRFWGFFLPLSFVPLRALFFHFWGPSKAFHRSSVKFCPKNHSYPLCINLLQRFLWRLWKQKVQNSCNARARVRTRGTLTHIFHKRKHFIFHLPFLPSRSLRQKVQEKVRQKRNYLGRFSKNVGDFLKNVGVFSKNVGDFQRFLRRYLYSIQHIPRSATILHFAKHYCYCLQWFPFKTGLVSLSDNGFCAVEQAHS